MLAVVPEVRVTAPPTPHGHFPHAKVAMVGGRLMDGRAARSVDSTCIVARKQPCHNHQTTCLFAWRI